VVIGIVVVVVADIVAGADAFASVSGIADIGIDAVAVAVMVMSSSSFLWVAKRLSQDHRVSGWQQPSSSKLYEPNNLSYDKYWKAKV